MKYANIILGIVLIVLSGVALFGVINHKSPIKEETQIRVGYSGGVDQAPFVVGIEKGFFNKKGFGVEFFAMKGGGEVKQALAGGTIDIGIGGAANFYLLASKGVPVKMITAVAFSPSYLMVRPNELGSLEDLVNKKVGGNPTGAAVLSFLSVMDLEGVDINKIQVVDVDSEFKLLSLTKQKVVDAVPVDAFDYKRFLSNGAVVLPEWVTKGYINKNIARSAIAVRTDFLNNNEDAVVSFLDGLIKSLDFIKNYPDESAASFVTFMNKTSFGAIEYKTDDIKKTWLNGEIIYSSYVDPKLISLEVDIAYKVGVLGKKITLNDFYDLRFDQKLKEVEEKIYGKNN